MGPGYELSKTILHDITSSSKTETMSHNNGTKHGLSVQVPILGGQFLLN